MHRDKIFSNEERGSEKYIMFCFAISIYDIRMTIYIKRRPSRRRASFYDLHLRFTVS